MSDRTDDWQLLEAYATQRSQEAFARLAARYADLVYHTALRQTRNAELAEDVAQAVFIALARSAGRLRPRGSLGAWLHQTTLCAAATALRSEARRRRHEQASVIEATIVAHDHGSNDSTTQVEAALHRLRSKDRQVLALHYLEGRTMKQTAHAMGISLEAARKRLSRALERLRHKLARRSGASLGAGAVASALAALSAPVTSSPASAVQITAEVIAGGKTGYAFTLAGQLLKSIRLLALKKAAAAVVSAAIVLGAARVAFVQLSSPSTAEADVVVFPPLPEQKPDPQLATPAVEKSVELPAALRDALARTAEQLTPITLTWTSRSQTLLSKRHLIHVMQMSDRAAESVLTVRAGDSVSFQDGKYRSWWDSNYPGQVVNGKPEREYSYDGGNLHSIGQPCGLDEHGRPLWLINRFLLETTKDRNSRFINDTYFRLSGYHLPITLGDLREKKPVRTMITDLLESEGKLAAIEQIERDGKKLLRIRIVAPDPQRQTAQLLPEQRVYLFDLDPALNHAAVMSEERTPDGRIFRRAENSGFEKLPDRAVYLPHKIVETIYAAIVAQPRFYAEPFLTTTHDLVEASTARLPEDRFKLVYTEPGTQISEQIGPRQWKNSYVDDDGAIHEGVRPRPTTAATTRSSAKGGQ